MDESRVTEAMSGGLTPEEFRQIVGRFASGVTVITAKDDDKVFGATASAVSSLSLEPPMLLVCLNKASSTGAAIGRSRRFAVNVLSEGQAELAVRFAGRAPDRFEGVGHDRGAHEIPLLHGALATMECSVGEMVSGGTHTVFLANVERATGRGGAPLAYYRGQFGRLDLAHDQAASEAIRERVLRRELPIGTQLDLGQLAEELTVPRGSVYQALAKLTGEGLVGRDPDGRFVVRPVTLQTVMDSVRTRFALQIGALALAEDSLRENDLAELHRLAAATAPGEELDSDSDDAYLEGRTALGETLISSTGGQAALDAFRRADVPGMIVRLWSDPSRLSAAQRHRLADDLERLVDGAEAGDLAGFVATCRDLIDTYGEIYAAAFADRPGI